MTAPTTSPRVTVRQPFAWSQIAWTTGIVTIAAALVGWTYTGLLAVLVLAGLCVAITLLILLGQLLTLPRVIMPVIVIVLVVTAAVLVLTNAPYVGIGSQSAPPMWRLLLDSVPRLLSTPTGTATRLDLIAPAAILVAAVHTIALVRAQVRGPRRQVGVAPLLAAATLYGTAGVLSAGTADRYGLIAALLIVLSLLAWVRPKVATLGAVLACAACATSVAAVSFPAGKDVRAVIEPPTITVFQPSLMPYLSLWAEQTDLTLFSVAGDIPNRVSLATYTGYDGVSWSSGTEFALVGSTKTNPLPGGDLAAPYDMTVSVKSIPAEWVPAAGIVSTASRADLVQDLTGGGLLWVGHSGEASRYRLTGTVDVYDDASLESASVPDFAAAAPFVEVPPLSPRLDQYVKDNLSNFVTRYDQAAALEAFLREDRTVDPKGPGGSSMAVIEELLLKPAASGGQVGTAEQFVSAYAVIARSLGLPSRVVIGAKLSDTQGVAPGSSKVVSSGDIAVWPEVYFSGVGWVAFDPVPAKTPTEAQKKHTKIRDGGDSGNKTGNVDPPVATTNSVSSTSTKINWSAIAATAGAGLGGAVLLAAIASLIAGLVVQQRLRRKGSAGGWTAIERGGRLSGVPPQPSWTSEVYAAELGRRTSTEVADKARRVGDQAESDTFAPQPLGGTTDWQDVRAVRRELRGTLTLPKRIWWFLSPTGWRRPR